MSAKAERSVPVVLSVAFPYAVIGPKAVGGAEVICSQIEAALPRLGYRSVAVAHSGSETEGELYGTHVPDTTITDEVRADVERAHQANIDRALREHPVALVHMHGLDFQRYRVPAHIPVAVTVHLPPSWYPEPLADCPANYTLICVSETQRQACPAELRERLEVIVNGVPFPDREVLREQGRYAVMLARICAEKNLHVGLDSARLANMPVLLGGEVFAYEAHQRYFREQIAPRLSSAGATHQTRTGHPDEPVARFLGPVGASEKARLLSRAACLLLPSLAPETSSLVAMEALAAGVPVIGMAVGAVPEIVEHGKTGFLIEPTNKAAEQLAAAMQRLPELSRATCREVAEARFPLGRMLDAYAALYERIARNAPEMEHAPAEASGASQMEDAAGTPTTQATHLRWICTEAELAALVPAWTSLWEKDAGATPFQHPAWLVPWWQQFGSDGELQALWVSEAGTDHPLAFLPLYTYHPEEGTAQLLLVGAGTSDYLDGVWSPAPAQVADEALQSVMATVREPLQVSLFQLRPGSPLPDALRRSGIPLRESEATSVIHVAGELPAKLRANTRRYARRAELQGALTFHVADTPLGVLACFDDLVRFHRGRWQQRSGGGVLDDPRVLAHHRLSLPLLQQAGLLRMFRLSLGPDLLGVLYALCDPPGRRHRTIYLYLIGFDESFAELSPGTLLLHHVWDYARSEGFSALDLLRGGESYKRHWGAEPVATWAVEHHGEPAGKPEL